MRKASKAAAIITTIVLCISVFGAAFCLILHPQHDCNGENCAVCVVLAQCGQRLREAALRPAAASVLLFFALCSICMVCVVTREAAGETPVSLKVKLLD